MRLRRVESIVQIVMQFAATSPGKRDEVQFAESSTKGRRATDAFAAMEAARKHDVLKDLPYVVDGLVVCFGAPRSLITKRLQQQVRKAFREVLAAL